ncbi:hypothetical protein EDEG_00174 [Edhazardia aedis USNM 41457]|uniref:Uncharacterized protein n=1 Tax=Edhazardia aedis (strain USNM 41457) TaxID=1003232 RepID=J9D7C9_EDHAE|nr:hypothetical protein EDEG_00174 [Edhazardia aedis USNM 41457]|eukprot:EJW03686.1 hypothetical protein EDEG_00174 [Edhazardia aedis USNM 41457]
MIFCLAINTDVAFLKNVYKIFNNCNGELHFMNFDQDHFIEVIKRFLYSEIDIKNEDSLQHILDHIKKLDENSEFYNQMYIDLKNARKKIMRTMQSLISDIESHCVDFDLLFSALSLVNIEGEKSYFNICLSTFIDYLNNNFSKYLPEKINHRLLSEIRIASNIDIIFANCEISVKLQEISQLKLEDVYPNPVSFIELYNLLFSLEKIDDSKNRKCIFPFVTSIVNVIKENSVQNAEDTDFFVAICANFVLEYFQKFKYLQYILDNYKIRTKPKNIQLCFSANKELIDKIFADLRSERSFEFLKKDHIGWVDFDSASTKRIIYQEWLDEIIETEKIIMRSDTTNSSNNENITYIQRFVFTKQSISNSNSQEYKDDSNSEPNKTFSFIINLDLEKDGIHSNNGGIFIENFGNYLKLVLN